MMAQIKKYVNNVNESTQSLMGKTGRSGAIGRLDLPEGRELKEKRRRRLLMESLPWSDAALRAYSPSILAWALLFHHASPAPLLSPLCRASGTYCSTRSRTATRHPLPFLLLALLPGMGFLSLFAKYLLITPSPSSLPPRPLCLTEAGLGALLSRKSWRGAI